MPLCACNAAFGLDSTALRDAEADVNCATVNPDEDGDCLADDRDNCPGISNVDQTDLDRDGVGDACDPRQGMGGDTILLFDGFGDVATSMQRWHDQQTGEANWEFEAGHVRHLDMTDSFAALQSTMSLDHDELTVEVGFDCDLRYGFRHSSPGTIVRSPTGVWPSTRYVAMYLRNAAIDIKWITVYTVR